MAPDTTTAMQPTRDPRATLPDLIEVLLNKGVHLNLDLIISVADIPLIGINLRATIAGIETMLEYGMMRQWDSDTREWVQRAVRTHLPIADDEEILAKMAGGHFQDNFYRTWRPGSAYLTSQRLIIHRRDPAETLWQARLESITSVEALRVPSIGGEERTRILIGLDGGSEATLSALDPDRLISMLRAQLGSAVGDASSIADTADTAGAAESTTTSRRRGRMWFLENLSSGGTWRGGEATLSEAELSWRSPMDNRARVRISPSQLKAAHREEHSNPTDRPHILVLDTEDATLTLAADDIDEWIDALDEWRPTASEGPERSDRGHDQQLEGSASWD